MVLQASTSEQSVEPYRSPRLPRSSPSAVFVSGSAGRVRGGSSGPGCGVAEFGGLLERFTDRVCGVEWAGLCEFNEAELKAFLGSVRSAQRALETAVTHVGVAADQLRAQGKGGGAKDMFIGAGHVSVSKARLEASRSAIVSEVAGLSEALTTGDVSGEHVDAITRHTKKLSKKKRAGFDFIGLLDSSSLSVDSFDTHVKHSVQAAQNDFGLTDTVKKRAASDFRHWYDHKTGMGKFCGSLDPERYETFTTAIEQHTNTLANTTTATTTSDETNPNNRTDTDSGPDTGAGLTKGSNLAASALVELVTSAAQGRSARNRLPAIELLVDHDTVVHGANDGSVRQTAAGHELAPETIARLCCDATIRKVTLDKTSVPINVGRKYRTATDAQWAAIKAQYSTCAWFGCDRPIHWCQLHHIKEWENGGPTNLNNLVPLCNEHHHQVHEGQWTIKLKPDRQLEITRPDGHHHTTTNQPNRKTPQT